MSVKVLCPYCSKELDAPDTLIGRKVACPRCSNRFAISADGNGSQPTGAGVPAAKTFMKSRFPPGHESATPVGQPPLPPPVQDQLRPACQPPTTPAAPPNPGTDTLSTVPAVPPPHPPAPSGQIAAVPPPTQPTASTTTSTGRTVQVAKFVADGAVQSRLELGQDGQLPQLVANEGKGSKEPVDDEVEAAESSPWLLIGVLCFSVLMSVVMLWVPSDTQQVTSDEKEQAREKIKAHYIGDAADIKPYQETLRRALQAHSRGNTDDEMRLYRQVLQVLHSEEYKEKGLTAPKWLSGSPNDRELEELLSVLLR